MLGRAAQAMNSTHHHAGILAVDDDARSLLALRELLSDESVKVVTATSADEALRCAQREDLAVILMDARMPGVDGFETARLMRERECSRHTPIIFLTGAYEDATSMIRGYEAGAVDYIVKPLVPAILKSKVAVFVELYRKNAALRASQQNLRALASHLQSVREEERIRIAREIHDELGQALTGLKMDLTWIVNRLPPSSIPLREKAQSMAALIDATLGSVRQLASRLRPEVLDRLGLAAAIDWQAGEFQRRSGIRCNVSLPAKALQLDEDRSTAAFRIFQELLTNVGRHAQATRVDVAVRIESDQLVLSVEDDGRGINGKAASSPKSLGLLGIHERVLPFRGRVDISSAHGRGTAVKVTLPNRPDEDKDRWSPRRESS
jgi:signal transduction histidine kinase